MSENEISAQILDAAISVHRELGGPGLLESYYEAALACELRMRGLSVETQKAVPVLYKGERIGADYRLDMLVEGKVVVECKAAEKDNPMFAVQTLTYLRLTHLRLGVIVNFGKGRVVDGFVRVANDLPDSVNVLNAETQRRREETPTASLENLGAPAPTNGEHPRPHHLCASAPLR